MLLARPYWYLRHGQTDWNARDLSQGRTDVPLNATGEAQAVAAAQRVARHWRDGATPIARIVSSPLSRALRTAEEARDAIARASGVVLPLTTDDDLIEVCFGVQEGEPMGTWYDPWIAGEFTPEGAERFADLRMRVVRAVNRALEAGEGLPLIVAHGGVFRSLRSAMGMAPNVRLANAVPLYLTPASPEWTMTVYEE
ncbi:histidine phosphatase family protein [Acidomonas methanolica]|uniref:Phosphoglycerate mutase n=3 Tax=Acidomonas methanolica TaxID=437 RepID=A0A023D124_ACIMT|nr:histidine phosphatase family protein [Acidomonas methanolica]MBU2654977.1 histidine phosphatase family protein [Acidomonas methanolica]TCS26328.1 putative phosphoglycerate mutase [Acidomonas methanolica]GAJ27822.1 phosphoglycerate mutase [Acidomonas methanolica NBRC 104435]GEK99141.1 phosphoglycerate mutase [Acidomonas methanolica NBRC 104435]